MLFRSNFRVSDEEYELINKKIELSQMSKQDYFIKLLTESNSVVQRTASSTAFCRTSLVLSSTLRPDLSMRPPVCSAAH